MSDTTERHCRVLATHEAHTWTYRERKENGHGIAPHVDLDEQHGCPGIEHDHEKRCCTEHRTHTRPHMGCILR